jgi:hypothetical protein
MRPRKQVNLTICAATLVIGLSGCADTSNTSSAQMLDLLTRTSSYSEQQHTLRIAEDALIDECMAAKGFRYLADRYDSTSGTGAQSSLDLEERRRDGFGLFRAHSGDTAAPKREISAAEQYVRRLSPERRAAYSRAMMGAGDARQTIGLPGGSTVSFPADGCLADARGRLFGDVLTWARVANVPETLDNRIAEQIGTDPAYVEALKAWRTCMRDRGYEYEEPVDSYRDLKERYQKEGSSQRLRAEEVAVAVADAECAQRARIPSAVREAKLRGMRALPQVEQEALRELTESWLSAVAAAVEVTDRSPEREAR